MKRKIKKDYWHKKMFVVNVSLFDADIGFCINASEKEIKKWLKKVSGEKYEDFNEYELNDWNQSKTIVGRTIPFLGGIVILLKLDKNQFRKSVSTISHEVMHSVFHLYNERRTPLTKDTDEIYAYMMQSIMLQILNKLY